MVKNVVSTVGKVKDKVEELLDQVKQLKTDVETIKQAAEKLKADLNSDHTITDGQKCKDNKPEAKKTIKDCYEFIYEPIKAVGKSGGGADGANGCCTTF